MSNKTFANGRGIAHKGSGGMSIAFPDVCKTPTPGGPVAIPYPQIRAVDQARKEVKKVKVDGRSVATKQSNFKMSTGDDAGTHKGIVSGTMKSKVSFKTFSMDVKVQGKSAPRALNPTFHNKSNASAPFPPSPGPNVTKILDDIDNELSIYEKVLQKASSMSYPDAKKAQNDAEQKLGNLVNQLHNATAGTAQHKQTSQQVEQVVKKALKGD